MNEKRQKTAKKERLLGKRKKAGIKTKRDYGFIKMKIGNAYNMEKERYFRQIKSKNAKESFRK